VVPCQVRHPVGTAALHALERCRHRVSLQPSTGIFAQLLGMPAWGWALGGK
jgi:hypothetical protein